MSRSASRAPRFNDPGHYAAHVFSHAVGGGMSSRLFQDVRENRGLAYSIYSFDWAYADTGLFGFYAATSAKHIARTHAGRRSTAWPTRPRR